MVVGASLLIIAAPAFFIVNELRIPHIRGRLKIGFAVLLAANLLNIVEGFFEGTVVEDRINVFQHGLLAAAAACALGFALSIRRNATAEGPR